MPVCAHAQSKQYKLPKPQIHEQNEKYYGGDDDGGERMNQNRLERTLRTYQKQKAKIDEKMQLTEEQHNKQK